jgi:APA family basic amino acid/polyamine antiporter
LVPILAIITCGYLMVVQPLVTWIRFVGWLAVGLVFYFIYGFRRSRLATTPPTTTKP